TFTSHQKIIRISTEYLVQNRHQIRVIFSLLCRTIVVKRLKLTPEKRSGGILRSQVDFPPFSGVSEWYRTAVQTAPGRDCRERNVTPPHQGDGRTVQVGI